MTTKPDTILYIGRFQPFHNGHMKTLLHALSLAPRVVVGLGSCNQPPSFKNPWDPDTRRDMILDSLPEQRERLAFIKLNDYPGQDELWNEQVRKKMEPFGKWAITGARKDESSYYLDSFPDVEVICPHEPDLSVSATLCRALIFGYPPCGLWELRDKVPAGTLIHLSPYIRR